MSIFRKERIRDTNTLVLETIMQQEPISRAAIAKRLNLTKATISSIVQQLLNASLITEIGSEDSTLGRKPILLRFCSQAGIAASIDIGQDTLSVLVTDLSGEEDILKQIQTPPPELLTKKIIELLTTMLPAFSSSFYGLIGITIGIQSSPDYNFTSDSFVQTLTSYFHVPVFLETQANLSVIGESIYFPSSKLNISNLNIYSDIELSILFHGQLYMGTHGSAGKFGHTIIESNGRPCPCGNRGCIEQYLSEPALLSDFATLDEFAAAYRNKTYAALQTADRFLFYLSIAINNIQTTFDPDIIIINSSFTNLFPELIEQLKKRFNHHKNLPRIIASQLPNRSVLLGGICVSVRNFLGIHHWILGHHANDSINFL